MWEDFIVENKEDLLIYLRLKKLILHNLFTFTAKMIKKHANIHIWNCKVETEFLTPILNVFKTMYISYNILIDIYHCSDWLLLLYYNKNETEFLAPKRKIIWL